MIQVDQIVNTSLEYSNIEPHEGLDDNKDLDSGLLYASSKEVWKPLMHEISVWNNKIGYWSSYIHDVISGNECVHSKSSVNVFSQLY